MIIFNDNSALEISCSFKTEQISFSIGDYNGKVVKRGDYICLKNNRLPIHDLPKGIYTLCLIDGDMLHKERFQKK